MSGVGIEYRNLDTGGYWGVAEMLRQLGLSDKCREEGGLWNAAVITHYRPGVPGPGNPPAQMQTYVGPDGYVRRVSFWCCVCFSVGLGKRRDGGFGDGEGSFWQSGC
jgi:hypothetical protein